MGTAGGRFGRTPIPGMSALDRPPDPPILRSGSLPPRAMKGWAVRPMQLGRDVGAGPGKDGRGTRGSIGRTSPSCRLFLILGTRPADLRVSRRGTATGRVPLPETRPTPGCVTLRRPRATTPPWSGVPSFPLAGGPGGRSRSPRSQVRADGRADGSATGVPASAGHRVDSAKLENWSACHEKSVYHRPGSENL
jgi:hypothetical protein